MKTKRLKNISNVELSRVMNRSRGSDPTTSKIVSEIIENIRLNGDKAVKEYIQKLNQVKLDKLYISKNEIRTAYKDVKPEFIKAVIQSIKNISKCNEAQYKWLDKQKTETERGIRVWREFRAIEKIGLYVPGGKAAYPSTVLMTGIPAKIAGCREVILCAPPDKNGFIPSPVLVAADMIGIKKIYKVGGAEAVAAMTFGTESIPKVYKIFGPGNKFVTEAKMQLFGKVSIDMPAGPSEIFIIADETANPKFIAADLLADGEHSEDSACVLLTTSEKIAEQTAIEIENQLKKLASREVIRKALNNYGILAVVESLDEAIGFCNKYAPEHLEIMTENPEVILKRIRNAGSIFLGSWTSKSAGDYATGANHVLPTGGMAKMFSALSIDSFGKMMEVQKVNSKKSLESIRNTIETFGEVESLPAHKNATSIRFNNKG